MALETATNISDLIATNPGINDPASRGDDHIRLIKQVLLNDLGSLNGALTITAANINSMETTLQGYVDTAVSDALYGDGNIGTVGVGGVVGDYQAADSALQTSIDQNASDISTLDGNLTSLQNNYLLNVYPVGSIYMNASNANNPSTYLGFGSWQAFGQGRVLLGAGQTSDGQETRAFTGGTSSGTFAERLTISQMPSHRHSFVANEGYSSGTGLPGSRNSNGNTTTHRTNFEGGGQPHNNMQPYVTVYIWQRIA